MTDYFAKPRWPKRRFNVISGASGAGKTTWIVPQLFALQAGTPIDDMPTRPTKVAYFCCDRTVEDASDTISRLGLDPSRLPIFSYMDMDLSLGWSVQTIVQRIPRDTELVLIEAVAALVPGGDISDYHSVLMLGRQLGAASQIARRAGRDLSFWGTTHSPKLKGGESFIHTRDNIIGSAAWGAIAGTIVHINEQPNGQRKIEILLRDGPAESMDVEFTSQGHLVPADIADSKVVLGGWLKQFPPGADLRSEQILERAAKSDFSRATAYRWLKEQVETGRLLESKPGLYKVRLAQ